MTQTRFTYALCNGDCKRNVILVCNTFFIFHNVSNFFKNRIYFLMQNMSRIHFTYAMSSLQYIFLQK